MNPVELRKWREAYPGIDIPDASLAVLGSFPSLFANDLADKMATAQPDLAAFVRALGRECMWLYGNWAKTLSDSNAETLIRSIWVAAGGSGDGDPQNQYSFVRKFLVDYCAANNLPNPAAVSQPQDNWTERLGLSPLGTVHVSSPGGLVTSQDPSARAPVEGGATVTVFSPDERSAA